MTTNIFFKWLNRCNSRMGSTPGRKVILRLDNCSAHGNAENIPSLSNVNIFFLPPNTTSNIQPMDSRIIAALKKRYRHKQMERAVDLADENIKDIYNVDILTTMKWIKWIWEDLPAAVVRNFWTHTGELLRESSEDGAIGERVLDLEISNNIGVLVPGRARMSIADPLNPVGEDECLQEEDDVDMVADIIGSSMDETVEDEEGNEDLSVVGQLLSAQEQLRALASTKRIPEYLNLDSATVFQVLRKKTQGAVRSTILSKAKQSTIEQFFK